MGVVGRLAAISKASMKVLCALLVLLGPFSLSAQPAITAVYQQLFAEFFAESAPFQAITGQQLSPYFPAVSLDSTSSRKLQILPAQVAYTQLDEGKIVRRLSISLTVRDSAMQAFSLSQTDTLSLSAFRKDFRQSPEPLQGDDPTARARWVRPISLIGLSVATFVALFYVRSR